MVELQQRAVFIRRASTSDASAISHVQVETWRPAYSGIISDEFLASLSKDDRMRSWTEILQQPDQATFVAEAGGAEIVGFASGGPEREGRQDYRGELYAIYVLPEWQRKGIGRKLATMFAHWLTESGYDTMLVWVLSLNPFRDFYENLGGKLIARKSVMIAAQSLEEAAYGWDDVRALAEGNGR